MYKNCVCHRSWLRRRCWLERLALRRPSGYKQTVWISSLGFFPGPGAAAAKVKQITLLLSRRSSSEDQPSPWWLQHQQCLSWLEQRSTYFFVWYQSAAKRRSRTCGAYYSELLYQREETEAEGGGILPWCPLSKTEIFIAMLTQPAT